jgi:hypothetical protein
MALLIFFGFGQMGPDHHGGQQQDQQQIGLQPDLNSRLNDVALILLNL